MKKLGKIAITIIVLLFLAWFVFGIAMTFGHKGKETIDVPEQLKILEKEIQRESASVNESRFRPISKTEFDDCSGSLQLNLYLKNDSITKTDERIASFLSSISERVKENLKGENCIDSLIVTYSINDTRNEKGVLIQKRSSFYLK